jgi:cytochrome b
MQSEEFITVWDLPLRLFHWLLVIAYFVAYATEDEWLNVHVWAGYLVLGLLIFRLIWGFVGGQYARFNNFLCSPMQSIAYIKDLMQSKAKRYIGHNPAGSAMIVLLLLSLSMTVVTGLAVYGADKDAGPLAFLDAGYAHLLEEIHELFANFSLMLVIVHVIGVVVESYIHRENLAGAMFHGNKKRP